MSPNKEVNSWERPNIGGWGRSPPEHPPTPEGQICEMRRFAASHAQEGSGPRGIGHLRCDLRGRERMMLMHQTRGRIYTTGCIIHCTGWLLVADMTSQTFRRRQVITEISSQTWLLRHFVVGMSSRKFRRRHVVSVFCRRHVISNISSKLRRLMHFVVEMSSRTFRRRHFVSEFSSQTCRPGHFVGDM